MLESLIRALILAEGDMMVVETASTRNGIAAVVDAALPDVIVAGGEDAHTASAYAEVLYRHPRMRIVLIDARGQQGHEYMLTPTLTSIGELSRDALIAVIRGPPGGAQPISLAPAH
jgi:chemotaxis response regulator CheB